MSETAGLGREFSQSQGKGLLTIELSCHLTPDFVVNSAIHCDRVREPVLLGCNIECFEVRAILSFDILHDAFEFFRRA